MRISFRRLIFLAVFSFLAIWLVVNIQYHSGQPRIEIKSDHHLCILIPFRNVEHELSVLVPELDAFLLNQSVRHSFLVLNQTDSYRFNRASLINVGWIEAGKIGCDYMVMHDVDIVPLNSELNYRYPGDGIVRHISSGDYHPIKRYNYKKFIGGVLMLTMKDFEKLNGMSNKYWGWGLEDDEFYIRMKEQNLTAHIERPQNLKTGRRDTFKHIHGSERKRDYAMIGPQKKMSRKRDRVSGLNTVQYSISKRETLMFGKQKQILVNSLHIELICDFTWTPYCSFN